MFLNELNKTWEIFQILLSIEFHLFKVISVHQNVLDFSEHSLINIDNEILLLLERLVKSVEIFQELTYLDNSGVSFVITISEF